MTLSAPLASPPRNAPLVEHRTIAVASGKGGVGKTWFAITLAHALARAGRRPLLFDGDLGLANVDIQLGLTPGLDLSDVVAGRATLAEAAAAHEGGFSIVAGRSGSGALSAIDPQALESLLAGMTEGSTGHDDVILDLGAGLDRPVRRMAAVADIVLVVATEEPTSLTDAYAVLKLHAQDRTERSEARIIINQASGRPQGERTYATLARACTQFLGAAPKLAGIIRRDERVRDAIRRQMLLLTRSPGCAAGEDVEAIAAKL